MRRLVVLGASALVALGCVAGAMADEDPLAGVYGNTVVMTTSKGEIIKLWINRDGTFRGESSKGQRFSGRWRLTDNNTKFCTTSDVPPNAPKDTPAPKESCFAFEPGHKAGDKWGQPEPNGEKKIIEIKAGT